MKAGETHVVPLPARAIELVEQAKAAGQDEVLVFPSSKRGNPLSNMVFLMMLRRMKLEVTAHGFRSSFRDWAAEETSFANFVVEKALAHAIDNKIEATYRRGDLLKKRRELMDGVGGILRGSFAAARGKPNETSNAPTTGERQCRDTSRLSTLTICGLVKPLHCWRASANNARPPTSWICSNARSFRASSMRHHSGLAKPAIIRPIGCTWRSKLPDAVSRRVTPD
jgi:hypothetical protein